MLILRTQWKVKGENGRKGLMMADNTKRGNYAKTIEEVWQEAAAGIRLGQERLEKTNVVGTCESSENLKTEEYDMMCMKLYSV